MKTTGNKRLCALLMALTLLLSAFPVTVFATGTDSPTIGASCNHTHGEDCGYNEGADCTHAHGDTCGWAEAVACDHAHDDTCGEGGEACAHVCGEGGCAFAEETPCAHTHDGDCGYIEAAPCTHTHDEACGGLNPADSGNPTIGQSGEGGTAAPGRVAPFSITSGNCGAAGNEANVQWEFDDTNGRLTISGAGAMADYNGSDMPWYTSLASIKEVVIEDGVTSIGNSAFERCANLASVTIGDGVETIGEDAFYGCTNLASVTIPDGVKTIGETAFASCGLTSITIPDGVETIAGGAFQNCTGLASVTIPDSVKTIGISAFQTCYTLTSVTFKGATPPTIGPNAFLLVASTGTIYYPQGASGYTADWKAGIDLSGWTLTTTIPTSGICGDPNVNGGKNVTWVLDNAGLLTISGTGAMADYNSSDMPWDTSRVSIKKVVIEGGVTSIGNSAFLSYSVLASVTIGDGVKTIGDSAFGFCSLTSITIPDSVETIGEGAFNNCPFLTSVTIGDGVTSIGNSAFYSCYSLTSITIPDSVETISGSAFYNCRKLTSVTFKGATPPTIVSSAFNSVASTGTIYYPQGASGYTADWKASIGLSGWTLAATPPTVTKVSATRTSSAAATAVFQSDGAGEYYHQLVAFGAGDPHIDTSGAGTSITANTETTINLTGIPDSAARDLWIYVKDGAGNVGKLTIGIPAHGSGLTPTLHVNPSGFDFGTQTVNTSRTEAVTVSGANLAGDITYSLSGDTGAFSVAGTGWNAASGGTLDVTFKPTMAGANYAATLTVSSPGVASVTVSLKGSGKTSGGNGGGGNGGSSSPGNSTTTEPSKPSENDPNPPTVGVVKPDATVDKNGEVKVEITDRDIQNAIDKALAQAKKDGTEQNRISVAIDLTGLKTEFNTLPLTLSKTAYAKLVEAGVQRLDIRTPQISLSLDLATLKTIHTAATGSVTINAEKIDQSKLTDSVKTALAGRPAYDLTITSGGKTISSFGGYVAITLPYTIAPQEQGGTLQMAYIDGAGTVRHMTDSSYNAEQKAMLGRTNHFTVFGIVEKPAPTFNDIEGHWAKDDILFTASRGLLNGTGENVFSPNGTMTRGMFVTALYRLAGSPQAPGEGGAFTDVPANAYYAGAVNWAAQKQIVSGTTATTFAPDRAVTRQEMAVIMANYAKTMGYTMPKTREAVTFVDNASIASWAKDAVKAMQMAGIINGKDGNRFDPTGTATRAEVAAVLHRYVELVIDQQTAQGWEKNDSGRWLYYENGKPVTGARAFDGTTYHFDQSGILQKIDAVAPETKKYIVYVVKRDDTLWGLAQKYHCTAAEIVALNSAVNNPDLILVDQEIKIPQK